MTKNTTSNIETELLKLAANLNNGTFLLGSKLLEVQQNEIYKQLGYESFTVWLNDFSKKAKVKKTKLWDSKKVVKMLNDTATPFSEVSQTSTKGLYQIARIHKKENDRGQTKKLIVQLSNKEITVAQLKELAKETIKPTESNVVTTPVIKLENNKKSTWEIKRYQGFFISLLLVACIIFYIVNAF